MQHKNVKLFAITLFYIGFTGLQAQTLKDIDGNVYKTITIGTQVWMAENLKTTKYRNGDLIGTTNPVILEIKNETTAKYQRAYDGNESNVATYGRLYTWYAITDSRNVCPTGWHVPSSEEWTTLIHYLINNGYGYEGSGNDIGKSLASTSGWRAEGKPGTVGNDQTSNNSSGFTALPGGLHDISGTYNAIGTNGVWWSSSGGSATGAVCWSMGCNTSDVFTGTFHKHYGLSVRCLRD